MCLAAQEKAKPKTTAGLFGGDDDYDEDGDIFSVGSRFAVTQQSKKVVEEEEKQPPEKKVVQNIDTPEETIALRFLYF